MKFESSKVLAIVDELSDSRFAGADGTERLSEYASARLTESGWLVEQIVTSPPNSDGAARSSEGFFARRLFESPSALRVLIQVPLGPVMADERPSRLGGLLKGLLGREDEVNSALPLTRADLSGLAMLLELARSWPKSWFRRFELILTATGGQSSNFAGADAIAREFDPTRSEISTLVLSVFGPGVGRDLIVVSGRHQDLAFTCAKSLWLPIAPSRSSSLLRRLWPASTVQTFPDQVALIGAGLESAEPPPLDADALVRAAQLVAEIALRWSKEIAQRVDHAGDLGDSRSEARSFQKPG